MRKALPIVMADIPEARLQRLEERIARLNERARHRGMAELSLRMGQLTQVPVTVVRKTFDGGRWVEYAETVKVPGFRVVIEGEVPRIPGWLMAGHVNIKKAFIDGDTGKARAMPATAFPGFSADEVRDALVSRLDAKGRIPCDHCRTVRNRKAAFVLVREEDGDRFVVGSECVADFSGHDPTTILRGYSGLLSDQEDLNREIAIYGVEVRYEWESFLAAERASRVPLTRFLAAAYECAREDGFHFEEEELPTAKAALAFLRSGEELSSQALAAAESVLRWLPNMGFRQDDLWKARRLGAEIGLDDLDLAARCLLAWCRATGKPLHGEHLGRPGDRLDLELRVTGASRSRNRFIDAYGREQHNEVSRWRFTTEDGSLATWQTGTTVDFGIDDVIACRATVKAHSVSRAGIAITEFARVSGIRLKHERRDGISTDGEDEAIRLPRP